jgi:hypothetical protein
LPGTAAEPPVGPVLALLPAAEFAEAWLCRKRAAIAADLAHRRVAASSLRDHIKAAALQQINAADTLAFKRDAARVDAAVAEFHHHARAARSLALCRSRNEQHKQRQQEYQQSFHRSP